ncbi:MAG: MoxR family ATPase [Candidatus Gracilibacteria bacterium]|nr:MoxR family ATPase [Candidatus Gracilibacteria bacterium]
MERINKVMAEISKKVIGQELLVRELLVCLLCKGHILLEGAPGLAKTLSVATLSEVLSLNFNRIQFTPDLLPSDLIGNRIYHPDTKEFSVKKGPIFSNLVLADEINRAPSKVQSALLEAMAERQVTIGDDTFKLDKQFMVLATQNPLEQDGTYSLPEAQLDRFLLKTIIDYPTESEEIEIMKKYSKDDIIKINKILKKTDLDLLQDQISKIHVEENIYIYVKDLIFCSRNNPEIKQYLLYGASPRASIALIKVSKANAFLEGRDFVIPEDIKFMLKGVLRHRIILNYESLAEGITPDFVIDNILNLVEIK